ncbi:MupA/Atu3671 family FMN-dependent luciferase-like monooxygenase [Pseudoalteromonas holothuriae]|nr:MupA/Atu3671 family FMN-dependent luciferase-like monooxygenase [Pseudoalteromonas sp. CIP111951]
MMQLQTLVNELNENGIYLFVSEGKLKAKSQPGAMTAEWAECIKEHKGALLEFFSTTENSDKVNLERVNRDGGCELSYSQQRLWFLDRLAEGTAAYNIPLVIQLDGELNAEFCQAALNNIVQRHESIRTCFREEDGQVRQFIQEHVDFSLKIVDLTSFSETLQQQHIEYQIADEAEQVFVLEQDLMLRSRLLKCHQQKHILLLTMHHIASDGWSLSIVIREFCELYNAAVEQRSAQLPTLNYQYVDHAAQQKKVMQTATAKGALNELTQSLKSAPRLHSLPLDKPRPTEQKYNGGVHRERLSGQLSARLQQVANEQGVSLFTVMETAFSVMLSRFSRSEEIVLGMPVANRTERSIEEVIGFFANTLVMAHKIDIQQSFCMLLKQHAKTISSTYSAQHIPFELLVEALNPDRELSYNPLFQIFIAFENASSDIELTGLQSKVLERHYESSKFDLSLYIKEIEDGIWCGWEFNSDLFDEQSIATFAQSYEHLLISFIENPDKPVASFAMLPAATCSAIRGPELALSERNVCEQIMGQALQIPTAEALVFEHQRFTYSELTEKVQHMCVILHQHGVSPGDRVGVYVDRKPEMLIAMLAIMSAGAAYVPLDPDYPDSRINYIVENASVSAVIVDSEQQNLPFSSQRKILTLSQLLEAVTDNNMPSISVPVDSPAYMIYTSGSTGNPKGVVVSHRNMINLFSALDVQLPLTSEQKTLLAVTSVSFDISVLELFWTLARGQRVVLLPKQNKLPLDVAHSELPDRHSGAGLNFSLYYFANDPKRSGDNKYRLLKEGALFADKCGFEAVWVPERHFHEFGGQFPNPSIAASALSLVTDNISLRAGSVVMPLHDPIRVAEDWSMIDNLSHGRAGLAITCGWHFNDFVFAPENYENRYEVMFESLEVVRNLWRGEGYPRLAGNGEQNEVKIRPLPIQSTIPVWITTAGNVETFKRAGRAGANLLTHILGQSPAELAEKIQVYKNARKEAGYDPDTGRVSVMVHTFVCDDMATAKRIAKAPFKEYLRSSIGLLKPFADAQGWGTDVDPEVLLEAGCERYFRTNALFGTVEHCAKLSLDLYNAGVDEIACLIDFGIEEETVIEHLLQIDQLHKLMAKRTKRDNKEQPSIAQMITREQVQWLQSTPSLAHLMLNEAGAKAAFSQLECLMLGGEYLAPSVLHALKPVFNGRLYNMYGPTETTVWSSVSEIKGESKIGLPLANTQFYLLDDALNIVPKGMIGELYIAGEGVTHGYFEQAALSAERYIPNPFDNANGQRLYRTGDLMRVRHDGVLDFCGRRDFQVKLRGYRIELGDIETALLNNPQVAQAVAAVRSDQNQNERLVGYVTAIKDSMVDGQLGEERVNSWQALYNETFIDDELVIAPHENFASWVSSYTDQAYPVKLMKEWIGNTVSRVPHQAQSKVLEIGVGTGLVLFRVAPNVSQYVGVDFAQNGLDFIRKHSVFLGQKSQCISLHQCPADQFHNHVEGQFDTIVLNSVIQYFPSAEYLHKVLEEATKRLRPGGTIFVGDVRHLQLHELFCSSVEIAKAQPETRLVQLKHRISERIANERELLLAPEFFKQLGLASITRVEVLVKCDLGHTEMSKYRYDVVLHTSEFVQAKTALIFEWQQDVFTVEQFAQLLDEHAFDIMTLDGVPHPLLEQDIAAHIKINNGKDNSTLNEQALHNESLYHNQTQALIEVAKQQGYSVSMHWDNEQAPQFASLQIKSQHSENLVTPRELTHKPAGKTINANNPLQSEQSLALIPALQRTAQQHLPEFMQPDTYIVVERWPYTANGKIDLARLPVPEAQIQQHREYVAPTNELETYLSELWCEILNLDVLGINDNFFEMGGRSLLAAQMLNRIKQRWQLELTVKALFENPTVAKLAKYMGQLDSTGQVSAIVKVDRDKPLPASDLQRGLWFDVHRGLDSTMYHMAMGLDLKGPFDIEIARDCLASLTDKHEILRCAFELEKGVLNLKLNTQLDIPLHVVDLSQTISSAKEQAMWQEFNRFKVAPFDLTNGPLVRLEIIKLDDNHHVLMYVIHHLISDGWSNRMLIAEFMEGYQKRVSGLPLDQEVLPIQYADYVHWMQQHFGAQKLNQQLNYWRDILSGAPALMPLPWDTLRTETVSDEGTVVNLSFDKHSVSRMREICNELAITPYMFCLATWQLLLSAWSDNSDILIGSPVSNRPTSELEKLVGYFVNTVVIRTQVDNELDWQGFMGNVKATTLDAYEHQDIPFSRVVEAISPERSASYMPIYQVGFSFESIRSLPEQLAGLEVAQLSEPETAAKYDLSVTLIEFEEQLQGTISFKLALFEKPTINMLKEQFCALAERLLERPHEPLSVLKSQVKDAFNQHKDARLVGKQQDRLQRLQSRKRR